MNVVVWVPWGGGTGEDGVPDYSLRGGFGGRGGWVDGLEVDKDLLGVPIKER